MDISAEVAAIQAASQGSELRQPLVGALNKLNSGSLPAVTISDAGKILKVGANGWEVGEKSGYMPVPTATKQITENDTYDVTDYASAIVSVSGGGGGVNILSGSGIPDSSMGVDGTIYLQNCSGIKNTAGQFINTGYRGSANSKYEVDFMITKAQTRWAVVFGGRPNAGSVNSASILSLAIAQNNFTNTSIQWGSDQAINTGWVGANGLLNKMVHAEISNGLGKMIIDGIPQTDKIWTPTTVTDTTPIGLFCALANGSYQSWSPVDGMILYRFKIYENDTLVHDFVPVKDTNDVACLYDEVAQEYKYANSGTLEFYDDDTIWKAYVKVNGSWQLLENSDIDDVNLGSVLISKTITQNGTYDPADDNADGYSEVIVDVPSGDVWPDEYIESSGTQYIDTGYYPNDNTDVEIIATVSRGSNSYPTIFGMRPQAYSTSGSHDLLIHFYSTSDRSGAFYRNVLVFKTDYTKYTDKKALYKIGKNGCGVKSEQYTYIEKSALPDNAVTGTYTIFIFNFNNMGSSYGADAACIMKLYRFRIYESGVLVHEFIPWKDSNDVVCLKDTVTGDLKYNLGTGTFTYGTDSNS